MNRLNSGLKALTKSPDHRAGATKQFVFDFFDFGARGGLCEGGLACFGASQTLAAGRWAGDDSRGTRGFEVIRGFSQIPDGAVHGQMA